MEGHSQSESRNFHVTIIQYNKKMAFILALTARRIFAKRLLGLEKRIIFLLGKQGMTNISWFNLRGIVNCYNFNNYYTFPKVLY